MTIQFRYGKVKSSIDPDTFWRRAKMVGQKGIRGKTKDYIISGTDNYATLYCGVLWCL